MLTEIRVGGFKSFSSVQHAQLAPITLIFGPNSSGKSSLIQALLLLKQSVAATRSSINVLDFNGHLVDLGDYKNAVHRHTERPIEFGISYKTDFIRRPTNYLLPPTESERSVDLLFSSLTEDIWTTQSRKRSRRYIGLEKCTYRIGGSTGPASNKAFKFTVQNADAEAREFGLRYRRGREHHFFRAAEIGELDQVAGYLTQFFNADLQQVEPEAPAQRSTQGTSTRKKAIKDLLVTSLFSTNDFLPSALHRPPRAKEGSEQGSDDLNNQYLVDSYGFRTDFLSRFADEVRLLFDQISYIGPFRRPPDRIEILRDRTTDTVGRAGEYFHYVLYEKDKRSLMLNRWLKKLNIPYTLELMHADLQDRSAIAGKVVQINYRDNRFNTNVSSTDIGFGIGQIIPIVVEGMLSENKIIMIEQPELHLHPKLQADIADLIVETSYSAENPTGNQWIIESHSELILLRLLRRVREGKLPHTSIRVLYVDPPSSANPGTPASQIFDLEIDRDGRFLVPWPNGFFDEQGAEIFSGSK